MAKIERRKIALNTVREALEENMRPLDDLLGQDVLFNAYIDTWRVTACGQWTDACLKRVEVLSWERAAPLRLLDHAWIRIDQRLWNTFARCHKLGNKELTLQQPVRGAATIVQYYRSNGTRDYGLQQQGFFGTKELSDHQRKILNSKGYERAYPARLREEALPFLDGLKASLSGMVNALQERKEDWRAVGRSPANAASTLRSNLRAVNAEIERRDQAFTAADALMALARLL